MSAAPTTATPRTSATVYRFGAHGAVVRLVVVAPDASAVMTPISTTATIAVVDRSGSMDVAVTPIIREIIPNALTEIGLPDTAPVELITFESFTVHTQETIRTLRASNVQCMGGTSMAEAASLTASLLASNPQTPYRLIVISDGMVSDIDRVLKIAADFEATLAREGRNAPVAVCVIRALTSANAAPDTRALACFGQLNGLGVTVPIDCHIVPRHDSIPSTWLGMRVPLIVTEESKKDMQAAIVGCLRSGGGSAALATISCGGSAVLARLPGAPAQAALMVPTGESFVLISEGADLAQLTVNGESVQVVEAKLESEDDIKPLLLYLESHARQLMVIGKDLPRVKTLVDWVGAVSSSIEMNVTAVGPDLVSRRSAILRGMSQSHRSVMTRIRSLANSERVDTLNSQRQADFLRGVGHGVLGRALARRAAKDDTDIEGVVRLEAKQLRNAIRIKPPPGARLMKIEGVHLGAKGINLAWKEVAETKAEAEPASFYSTNTFTECLDEFAKIEETDLDDLTVGQIMRLVGPIGYTFRARGGDAPDPWSCFQVEQVYVGDTGVLLSCDLWEARTQGGANPTVVVVLKDPATEKAITGVLPASRLAPAPAAVMQRLAPMLFNLHVSAALRNSLVPMPGDYQAMTAAVTVRLCVQLAEEKEPSTATARALLDVSYTLAQMHGRRQLLPGDTLQGFARQDPRPYLAGDLLVASGLKPLAAVLAGASVCCSVALAKAIVGHSLYLAAGRAFRSPSERTAELNTALGISAARDTPVGAPGTPDPDHPVFCTEYPASTGLLGDALAPEYGPRVVRAVWLVCRALWPLSRAELWDNTAAFLKGYKDAVELTQVEGIFGDISDANLVGALAVQAVKSPTHESRIKIELRATSPFICSRMIGAAPVTGQRARLPTANIFDALPGEETNEEVIRTYRFPDICTDAEAKTYIGSVVAEIYEERYRQALKAKRIAEEAERCRALIEALVNAGVAPSAEGGDSEFVRLLTAPVEPPPLVADRSSPANAAARDRRAVDLAAPVIDDRSSPGYAPLVAALCDLARDVPKRLAKLWILITGRDNRLKPVWCTGNFLRGDLSSFKKVFEDSKEDPDGKFWAGIIKMRARYGTHQYNRDGPNRHGHGNSNPSWWALGYDSPAAYQAADPTEFAAYTARRRAGGRGIPSWMRDPTKKR